MSMRRLLSAAIVWLVVVLTSAMAEGPTDVPAYTVGFWNLGPDEMNAPRGPLPTIFTGRLQVRPELDATLLERRPPGAVWYRCPKSFAADRWVTLAVVIFRQRQNWLAFVFDAADGGVVTAAWRPSLNAEIRPETLLNAVPPGPDSVSHLAQIELASQLAHQLQTPRAMAGPLIQVKVEKTALQQGGLLGGDTASPAGLSSLDLLPEQTEGLRALALAAAWEAGLKPTLGPADNSLTFRVAKTVNGYQVTAVLDLDGKRTSTLPRNLHDDALYSGLRALVNWAWTWQEQVVDVVQVEAWPVRPLLYLDHSLIVQANGHFDRSTIRRYDADSLQLLWELKAGEGARVLPQLPGSSPRLITFQPKAMKHWSLQDGSDLLGAGPAANHPWSVALLDEETALAASEAAVVRTGRQGWRSDFRLPVDAGPLVVGDRVFAGSSAGRLRALALTDGATLWETELRGKLFGPIVPLGDRLLVATQHGRLTAVNATDGAVVWSRELGDALVIPPLPDPAQRTVTIVHGGTMLSRLDSATGEPLGDPVRHPVLALYATPMPVGDGQLALVDAAGTVTFYRQTNLAVVRRVALGTRPAAEPMFIADAPVQWSAASDLKDRSPMLMVPGSDGVCYLLAIPQ